MKIFEGIVISVGTNKLAVVEVSRKIAHPLYKKLIKRSKKYKVDATNFEPVVGSLVKIIETRPISKGKYFKILSITGVKQLKKTIEPIDELDSSIKPATSNVAAATTETLKKTETQKLSASEKLRASAVARKVSKQTSSTTKKKREVKN